MTITRTVATARRVVQQLQHDHRTVALILVVPCVLMGLLAWMLSDADFNQYGAPLLGIFPLIVMFLTTSVATLRERESGTLERLLSMPIAKVDFVLGYALAFGLLGVVQALVVSGLAVGPFGLEVAGPTWALIVVAVIDALLGTALGLFVSAFAKTEFQAVQFMPALILPQLLLCGIVVPREELPTALRLLSDVLPMSYAVDATTEVMTSTSMSADFWLNVGIVALFMAVGLALGAGTLRRRTP